MAAAAVIPLVDGEVTVFTSAAEPVPGAARTVHLPLDASPAARAGHDLGAGGGRSAHGLLHWAPTDSPGHTDRLAAIAAWVAEVRPQAFVVDVSVEVAAFVRLLGVPVISFTLPGDRNDPAHRLGYALSDAVIAPWPADRGPDAGSVPADRLHRVGALSRFAPLPVPAAPARTSGPVLVLHGRGGAGVDPLDLAAAALEAAGVGVRHLRDAEPAEVWRSLVAAPLVLSHCGSNAVAEIAAARRPAILIPDARPHDEQHRLAEALTEAALPCVVLRTDDLARADWAAVRDEAAALDGNGWERWNDGAAAARIADVIHRTAAPADGVRPPVPAGGAAHAAPVDHALPPVPAGRVAVITTVAGRRTHLARQQEWLARAEGGTSAVRVIVAMDDAPVDAPGAAVVRVPSHGGALPLAAARNAGAEAAITAGAELLVFLDVDCLPRRGLLAAYRQAAARRPDALLTGSVGYLPEGVDYAHPETFEVLGTVHGFRPRPAAGRLEPARHELFWSLSFACRVPVWQRIGGFDTGYTGYGGEDTDFGATAREAGVELLFAGGAEADHQYHPVSDPPVEHLDDILRNAARFRAKWGSFPMTGWLDAFEAQGLIARDTANGGYARTRPPAAEPTRQAAPASAPSSTPARHHLRTDAA